MSPRLLILVLLPLVSSIRAGAILPLRDQWMAATEALAAGHAPTALSLLREFQDWYGNEPEALDTKLQEALHRLWGLAALESGQLEEGIEHLEIWLGDYPDAPDFRAFLRFQTAAACRAHGDFSRARFHAEAFLEDFPELPERALVRWQLAEMDLFENQNDQARSRLLAVEQDSALPPSGRMLARAALALLDLQASRAIEAYQWLADPPAPDAAPQILDIWRSILAPALVVQLIQAEAPRMAASAGMWFDQPENLRKRFAGLPGATMQANARQRVWNGHWQSQLQRIGVAIDQASAEQMDPAAAAPLFTPEGTLYDLRLRALLAAGDYASASILANALLASSLPVASELRATAFAAAIEACQRRQLWSAADALCARFFNEYPDHPDLPRILFLQAATAAGRRNFGAAIDRVDHLCTSFVDNPASLSWRLAAAGWALEAGLAADALQRLADLQPVARPSWLPFLRFQSARAFAALERGEEAETAYTEAAIHPAASPFLVEQALTGLLRLHLDAGAPDAFRNVLSRYRKDFPDGANRLMVTCLEGSMEERLGRMDAACAAYRSIASEPEPAAGFAREQLASLLESGKDWPGLRSHLTQWLQLCLDNDLEMPFMAFDLALRLQGVTAQPAFPTALADSLMDALNSGSQRLPAGGFLRLLASKWPQWRDLLRLEGASVDDWLDAASQAHRLAGRLPAYAACQLFLGRRLRDAGRSDSADTRLIEVLQSLDPRELAPSAHLQLAEVAHRYDFPEAAPLLEDFIDRYPSAESRPEALFLLAGLQRRSGDSDRARLLLEEIASRWPDALIANSSCLQLAAWELQDGSPVKAATRLHQLLEQTGLPASMVAEGLLLRAKADLASGNPGRASLSCRRILALYPDLKTYSGPAAALLADLHPQNESTPVETSGEAG